MGFNSGFKGLKSDKKPHTLHEDLHTFMQVMVTMKAVCFATYKLVKKCKVHPCTGTEALYRSTARRGRRGITLHFHDYGTRRG